MKNFIKLTYLLLFVCIASVSLTSCGDDDNCYECDVLGVNQTFCEGEEDEDGVIITAASLEEGVAAIVAFGGTCEKK